MGLRTMKVLLTGPLLAVALLTSAQARTPMRERSPALARTFEQAATTCFAETIAANPRAMALARASRWYEAAGVTGFLCRPEVDALILAHDGLHGSGTGSRYFQTTYIKHLGGELATRLQPMLRDETLANAEPSIEKASLIDAGADAVRQKPE